MPGTRTRPGTRSKPHWMRERSAGREVAERSVEGRRVRGRDSGRSYEAAKTTRVNRKHWLDALGGEADKTILPALATLRNRSRYEIRNNGYAEGMVETHVADVVGPNGPSLEIESDDEAWNQAAEQFLSEYFTYCDASGVDEFVEQLKLGVRQLWECGEIFAQKITDPESGTPVRMRVLVIEPDRVATPGGFEGQDGVRGGVKVNANSRPIEYYVLKQHPGSLSYLASPSSFDTVPARDMIHVFRRNRPGQTRGVPWLAPVLDDFGHLRDYDTDTMLAARMAAMLAAYAYTDNPDVEFDDLETDLPIWNLEPATLSFLPHGWKMSQLKPEHPSTQYKDFKHEKLAGIGRVVGMPYLKIAADAAGHNYSSARLDDQGYWDIVETIQSFLSRRLCNRIALPVLQEAWLSCALGPPPVAWKATWVWNQRKHVDPLKEEQASILRLASGTTTWAAECMARGRDWRDVFKQLKKEMAFAAEQGLKLDFGALVMKAAEIIKKQAATPEDEEA